MQNINSVCVYCGSSNNASDEMKEVARITGKTLAERGITTVYGGGHVGLMGITADSALAAGGKVVGIIPDHLQRHEKRHETLTELIITDSMHTRKRLMVERSDAFFVLPGGLGTLDEMFEILTWRQLELHDKPVIMINWQGYWDKLIAAIDNAVDEKFIRPQHRAGLTIVDNVPAAMAALDAAADPAFETDVSDA
ncbi:MAG: TIGR00730 family Rossman fold protein [Alphaproteobacteria bacterium]|nr:TIGR00730 family Rossman fold protein [Alphaproteobacteria bacterium SS10]